MREKKKIKKIVQLYRKERGAVAVFLVIILVPCIVAASLFVDVSRVQYSKMEATSAADLTLHSLMANYDEILLDYYGLVSSCQTIDEFYDTSEKYFGGIMRAAGCGDGSELFTAYIQSMRNGSTSDFLKTEFLGDIEVKDVPKGNLGENPALIEDGIVEFMKYRGLPRLGERAVDLTKRIANSCSEAKGSVNILDILSNAEGDKEIKDAKENYGEKESKLLEDAFHTYLAILVYERDRKNTEDYSKGTRPSKEYYDNLTNDQEAFVEDLISVTQLITKVYAETEGIELVSFPEFSISEYKENSWRSNQQKENIASKVNVNGSVKYYLTKSTYDSLMTSLGDSLQNKIDAIENAAQNVVTACQEQGLLNYTATMSLDSLQNGSNPAIYCRRIQQYVNANDLDTIRNKGSEILELYAKAKAALSCEEDPAAEGDAVLPTGWRSQLDYKCSYISSIYEKYLSTSYGTSSYGTIRDNYYNRADADRTVQRTKNRTWTFNTLHDGTKTLGEFASIVTGRIQTYKDQLQYCIKQLTQAIDGGSVSYSGEDYNVVSLDTLVAEANEKSGALDRWEVLVDNSNSDYAKDVDKPEIERIKANLSSEEAATIDKSDVAKMSEDMSRRIDGPRVEELKKRLVNIRQDLQYAYDRVDQVTYGGQKLSSLNSAEAYINAAVAVVPRSGNSLYCDENNNAGAGYATSLTFPTKSDVYHFRGIISGKDGNNPDLLIDTPELYKYLKAQFGDNPKETADNTKAAHGKLDEFKNQAESSFNLIGDMDPHTEAASGGSIAIATTRSTDTWNAFSALSTFVNQIKALTEGDGGAVAGDIRDKIYVAEYLMDMLTYSSSLNEGQYRYANEEKGTVVTLKDYDSYYGVPEWGTTDAVNLLKDQSLTNKVFGTDNNASYLGEVEYVLYGKSGVKENDKSAYKSIFAIREIVDLASGFLLFWKPTSKEPTSLIIESIAMAIANATCGIIPTVLTKTVIIAALSTLEACSDLDALKRGAAVTIFKTTTKQWKWAIPSGDWRNSELKKDDDSEAPEDKNGLYYSDYIYVFLLMAMTDENCYKAMLLRTSDVIQENMKKHGKNDFDMNKARCYFSIHADMQVQPLMLEMPLVQNYDGVNIPEFTKEAPWCRYSLNTVRGYS